MPEKLPSGDYWYSADVKTTLEDKRGIMATFLALFLGISMLVWINQQSC